MLDPVSMGIQAASTLAKIGLGIHQSRLANKIKPVRTDYSISPYAQNQLGLAQQLYNGRMFGASQQEQNIFANQGNTLSAVNRNASDASTALAMAAATQGQTNQALANLGMQEGQNKYQMLGNLNAANANMTNELDKVYKDKMMKYQEDVQAKTALRNAAWQNFGGAMNGLQDTAMMGGFDKSGGYAKDKYSFDNVSPYTRLQSTAPYNTSYNSPSSMFMGPYNLSYQSPASTFGPARPSTLF